MEQPVPTNKEKPYERIVPYKNLRFHEIRKWLGAGNIDQGSVYSTGTSQSSYEKALVFKDWQINHGRATPTVGGDELKYIDAKGHEQFTSLSERIATQDNRARRAPQLLIYFLKNQQYNPIK